MNRNIRKNHRAAQSDKVASRKLQNHFHFPYFRPMNIVFRQAESDDHLKAILKLQKENTEDVISIVESKEQGFCYGTTHPGFTPVNEPTIRPYHCLERAS